MSAINLLQQKCVRFLRRTYTPFRCRACVVAKSAQLRFRLRRKLRSLPAPPFPTQPASRLFLFCGSGIISVKLPFVLKTQICRL